MYRLFLPAVLCATLLGSTGIAAESGNGLPFNGLPDNGVRLNGMLTNGFRVEKSTPLKSQYSESERREKPSGSQAKKLPDIASQPLAVGRGLESKPPQFLTAR